MSIEAPARWRRRKGARPAEIMAAALECFRDRGFAATRLEDVASRAGVTKGTIYLYYSSKEDLFKAVVRGAVAQNLENLEALLAEPIAASVVLKRLLKTWETVVASPASVIPKLVIAEAGNFPELARFYLDAVAHRGINLIAAILRRGIEQGEFRPVDVDHVVFCVIGPLLFTALWKHSLGPHDDRPLNVPAVFRAHLDLLLNGLRRDDAKAPPRTPARERGKS
jgi:AcrR family transcriptional regulator